MRYFIEVSYKGTNYAGFQVQQNATTIQSEIERVLAVIFKIHIKLTGSSRTDAGVHALQNYFQADVNFSIQQKVIYNLNALLPSDIVIKAIHLVKPDAHARFDALSREYSYYIYTEKDPFMLDTAWFYPYNVNFELLQAAAGILLLHNDFTSFAKRNSQVHTHICTISKSEWSSNNGRFVYTVKANRFLRGMVRGLVGTMMQVGRGAINLDQFVQVIEARDCNKANFATPPHGLFLKSLQYPSEIFM